MNWGSGDGHEEKKRQLPQVPRLRINDNVVILSEQRHLS